MAAAGPHLREIITDERRLSASQLCDRLQGMRLLALATVTGDGRPLVGPVDGYFIHGSFYFGSGRRSVRMGHLARRPGVSATHLPGEELAVTVHGRAELFAVGDPAHAGPCSTTICRSRARSSRSGWTGRTRSVPESVPTVCSPSMSTREPYRPVSPVDP
jgi:hypothetical protein